MTTRHAAKVGRTRGAAESEASVRTKVLDTGGGAVAPLAWRHMGVPEEPPAGASAEGPRSEPDPELARQTEERVRQAHAAGFREGREEGRNQAAQQVQPVMERLTRGIEDLAGLRSRLRHDAEADLVTLALAVARRVLRRELSVDPEAIRGVAMAALEKLDGQEISRVRVHPAHAAELSACLRRTSSGGAVEVVSDTARELGFVIFETERGSLDASVDTQLEEIERGLADRLRRQG
ncbi:MAG: FliH/SctL family protein [Bryobacteraceae bacterium]